MSTYPAGTVAVATVKGKPNVRVMRSAPFRNTPNWASSVSVDGNWWFRDDEVTDVRPLVVLDLDEQPFPKSGLEEFLRNLRYGTIAKDWLADQIEAQTKPPRIPEPGLWGVVEAKYGDTPVRTFVRERDGWSSLTNPGRAGVMCDWDRLVDPVLIRDGIEDGAS